MTTLSRRPFPWGCPACGAKEVYPTLVAYNVEVLHDGALHLVEIPRFEVPRCRQCQEMVFDSIADAQITAALRLQVGLLSTQQLQSKRKALGLTVEELALRVGIDPQDLAEWEEGLSTQGSAADRVLRQTFAVLDHVSSIVDVIVPTAREAGGRPST